jgi:membrane-bound serine protease (ClpP class)
MKQKNQPPARIVARRLSAAFTAVLGIVLLSLNPVAAQSDNDDTTSTDPEVTNSGSDDVQIIVDNQVRIIEVSGLLDPVMHDFLLRELGNAERDGVLGVLLQYDSSGSVIDDDDFTELALRLRDSPLQVAIWVGPSGSRALGGSAELLGTADLVGVAVGSRIGETGPARLPPEFPPAFGDATARLETASIGAFDALELGITTTSPSSTCDTAECSLEEVSVIRQFLTQFDGYRSPADTSDATQLTQPRFVQLPITAQLFHTVASPEVAYLLFIGGLALLIFELFTAGVGVAGSIGVFCLIFGCYGLSVLPARPFAIALLLASLLAFAVDIQTNMPRIYTAVGMVLFVLGTWFLYDGLRMSLVTTGVGIVGAALYAYTGMPSMVRTRFSSPTIGRSWMIGEMGEAATDVSPEGTVLIQGAPWRALTNRATPVKAGDQVRVVGITRMVLDIEPEAGGAKDYRERG